MSSVLAVKLVSGLRRKPNPSGRISRTPSANTCSPVLARFLMMANISSCLRMRPVFSILRSSACLRTSDTCSALSSFKCMDGLFGAAGGVLGRGIGVRGGVEWGGGGDWGGDERLLADPALRGSRFGCRCLCRPMVWARLWQEKYPAPCPTWCMAIERQKQMAAAGLSFAHRPALWTAAPAFGHILLPRLAGPFLICPGPADICPRARGLIYFWESKNESLRRDGRCRLPFSPGHRHRQQPGKHLADRPGYRRSGRPHRGAAG